jgi:hypothetical protein
MHPLVLTDMDVNIRIYMSKLVVSSNHKVIHEFEPRSADFPDVIVLSNSTFGALTHEAVYALSNGMPDYLY